MIEPLGGMGGVADVEFVAIEEVGITPLVEDDYFGQVSNGFIKMKSRLLRLLGTSQRSGACWLSTTKEDKEYLWHPDVPLDIGIELACMPICGDNGPMRRVVGLLITPSLSKYPGAYTRLGVAHFFSDDCNIFDLSDEGENLRREIGYSLFGTSLILI